MAKKKYYAVRNGVKPGIYETGAECEKQTKGFAGAIFKSFPTREEAEEFLAGSWEGWGKTIQKMPTAEMGSPEPPHPARRNHLGAADINAEIERRRWDLAPDEVIAFTDGSYSNAEQTSGYGAIIMDSEQELASLQGAVTLAEDPEYVAMRNVSAELDAVKAAVTWAITHAKRKSTIYYDDEGIGRWADGSWRTNKELTRAYAGFIEDMADKIEIELIKVPAHSGVAYNEKVDELAKSAIHQA